jgi:hypothetical protein
MDIKDVYCNQKVKCVKDAIHDSPDRPRQLMDKISIGEHYTVNYIQNTGKDVRIWLEGNTRDHAHPLYMFEPVDIAQSNVHKKYVPKAVERRIKAVINNAIRNNAIRNNHTNETLDEKAYRFLVKFNLNIAHQDVQIIARATDVWEDHADNLRLKFLYNGTQTPFSLRGHGRDPEKVLRPANELALGFLKEIASDPKFNETDWQKYWERFELNTEDDSNSQINERMEADYTIANGWLNDSET